MKVAVIGGGAAGMMAAIAAAQQGADVTLLEKNQKLGKKLYISGKGRCNLTNNCQVTEFLTNVVSNAKFLQGALHKFSPDDTMQFCSQHNLPLKVERGNRVFPLSDKSSDVIAAFARALNQSGAKVIFNCAVQDVSTDNGGFLVQTQLGQMFFDKVIVATGGVSYPATGSDGFGLQLAKKFHHNVTPLFAALCRILCGGTKSLQGLSLKNVQVSYILDGKKQSQFGEMLFTDDGVSGPAVLTLSSLINKFAQKGKGEISIDLKPALDQATLDARVLRDFSQNINKNFGNALDKLLPQRLVEETVRQSGISFFKKVHQITAAERAKLVYTLKNLRVPFVSLDAVEGGIVTCGGVDVAQINPATMQSKLQSGLFFAGEVMDIDALTGGFNIQCALSTGFVAGTNAAKA